MINSYIKQFSTKMSFSNFPNADALVLEQIEHNFKAQVLTQLTRLLNDVEKLDPQTALTMLQLSKELGLKPIKIIAKLEANAQDYMWCVPLLQFVLGMREYTLVASCFDLLHTLPNGPPVMQEVTQLDYNAFADFMREALVNEPG